MSFRPPSDGEFDILDEVQQQLTRWRNHQRQGRPDEAGLELAGIEATAMLIAHDHSLVFRIYELAADGRFASVSSSAVDQLDGALDRIRPMLQR